MDKKTVSNTYKYLKKIYKLFTIGTNKPILAGSSSLKQIKYFGDFDFFVNIPSYTASYLYENIERILNNDIENLFFIEQKYQFTDGSKQKIYKPSITRETFDKYFEKGIDFFKFDWVYYHEKNNRFIDISVIYFLTDKNINKKSKKSKKVKSNLAFDLSVDAVHMISIKNYYKSLKRYYSLFTISNNKKMIDLLTKFFNTDVGQKYELVSTLEAYLNWVNKGYDKINKEMNSRFLQHLSFNKEMIKKIISKNKKDINMASELILKNIIS
jgi:hypothetical protein